MSAGRTISEGCATAFAPARCRRWRGSSGIEIPQIREAAEPFVSKLFPCSTKVLRTEPLRAMVIGAFVRGLSMRDTCVARCTGARALIEHALREGWRVDAERITCPVRIVWVALREGRAREAVEDDRLAHLRGAARALRAIQAPRPVRGPAGGAVPRRGLPLRSPERAEGGRAGGLGLHRRGRAGAASGDARDARVALGTGSRSGAT
jgi:hypothetical protein